MVIVFTAVVATACVHVDGDISLTMEGCSDRIARDIARHAIKEDRQMGRALVASPVDAVSLSAGKLGISMQELLTDAMVATGIHVVDVELRDRPIIKKGSGIICLSRNKNRLKKELAKADFVLVTTYIVGTRKVVFTSRLVDLKTGSIIASSTRSVYRSSSVDALIDDSQGVEKKLYEN